MHANDARQLRDRQERHHRVAERNPRKAADQNAAQVLHRDPDRGREPEAREAEPANEQRGDRPEDRDVGGHVEREQAGHEHRDDDGKPAERRHRRTGPVHGADVMNEPGEQPAQEALPRRCVAERDQQRHERDEGDCGMAVLWKREG